MIEYYFLILLQIYLREKWEFSEGRNAKSVAWEEECLIVSTLPIIIITRAGHLRLFSIFHQMKNYIFFFFFIN